MECIRLVWHYFYYFVISRVEFSIRNSERGRKKGACPGLIRRWCIGRKTGSWKRHKKIEFKFMKTGSCQPRYSFTLHPQRSYLAFCSTLIKCHVYILIYHFSTDHITDKWIHMNNNNNSFVMCLRCESFVEVFVMVNKNQNFKLSCLMVSTHRSIVF